jgi:hypothetical protein
VSASGGTGRTPIPFERALREILDVWFAGRAPAGRQPCKVTISRLSGLEADDVVRPNGDAGKLAPRRRP